MALTAISGVTKSSTIKSGRQMAFEAKEDTSDTAVACPPEALKSLKFSIGGVNDEGAFGPNTVGQKGEGELILYAADESIIQLAHELVTKTIAYCKFTTISGLVYTFESSTTRPAITFSYADSDAFKMVTTGDEAAAITLKMTVYRDNQQMS